MRSSRSSGSLSPSDARSDPAQGERRAGRGEDGEGSYPYLLDRSTTVPLDAPLVAF
jgi:hypothetical protein